MVKTQSSKWLRTFLKLAPYLIGIAIPLILYKDFIFNDLNFVMLPGATMRGRDPWGESLATGVTQVLHNLFAKNGWFTLWEPGESTGKVILGDPHYKILNIFQLLAIISPSLDWLTILAISKMLLSYSFMNLYLRRLHLHWVACLMGAAAWVANGYFVGYISHNHFDVYMAIPILYWSIHRFLDTKNKSLGFFFLCFSYYLIFSGGNPQPTILIFLSSSVYLMGQILSIGKNRKEIAQLTALSGAALVAALMILAPDILGLIQLNSWLYFQPRIGWYPSSLFDNFVRWLIPHLNVNSAGLKLDIDEGGFYYGYFPLILIFVFFPWVKKNCAFYLHLSFVAFACYLCSEAIFFKAPPLRLFTTQIPVLNSIRYSKYFEYLIFSFSTLLAYSIDWIFLLSKPTTELPGSFLFKKNGNKQKWTDGFKKTFSWAVLLLFVALTVNLYYQWFIFDKQIPGIQAFSWESFTYFYLPYLVITTLALILTTSSWMRKRLRILAIALSFVTPIGIVAGYVHFSNLKIWEYQTRKNAQNNLWYFNRIPQEVHSIEDYLKKQPTNKTHEPYRILPYDNTIKPVLSDYSWEQYTEGANPIQFKHYQLFFQELVSPGGRTLMPGTNLLTDYDKNNVLKNPFINDLNIRFFVTFAHRTPKELKPMQFVSPGLYENPNVVQRAFFTSECDWVKDSPEAIERLKKQPSLFTKTALLVNSSKGETFPCHSDPTPKISQEIRLSNSPGSAPRIHFLKYEAESINIELNAPQKGFLILTDAYYPAWKATVNQIEVPLYLAQGAFRAVPVPAGQSIVHFYFHSMPWRLGLLLTAIGFCGLVGITLWLRQNPWDSGVSQTSPRQPFSTNF